MRTGLPAWRSGTRLLGWTHRETPALQLQVGTSDAGRNAVWAGCLALALGGLLVATRAFFFLVPLPLGWEVRSFSGHILTAFFAADPSL